MEIQNKILNHCNELFMKFGFKTVSMDDIAKSLGISKKTIYKYFETKDILVEKTVDQFIEKDHKQIKEIIENSQGAIDEIISIASYILKIFQKMSPRLIFDLQKYYPNVWDKVQDCQKSFVFDKIRLNLEKGIEQGHYRTDMNPNIVAKFYMILAKEVVNISHFDNGEIRVSTIYKQLIKYHLNGILSEKGKEFLIYQEIL